MRKNNYKHWRESGWKDKTMRTTVVACKWLNSKKRRSADIRDFIAVYGKVVKPSRRSQGGRNSREERETSASEELDGRARKKTKQVGLLTTLERLSRPRKREALPASRFTTGVRRKQQSSNTAHATPTPAPAACGWEGAGEEALEEDAENVCKQSEKKRLKGTGENKAEPLRERSLAELANYSNCKQRVEKPAGIIPDAGTTAVDTVNEKAGALLNRTFASDWINIRGRDDSCDQKISNPSTSSQDSPQEDDSDELSPSPNLLAAAPFLMRSSSTLNGGITLKWPPPQPHPPSPSPSPSPSPPMLAREPIDTCVDLFEPTMHACYSYSSEREQEEAANDDQPATPQQLLVPESVPLSSQPPPSSKRDTTYYYKSALHTATTQAHRDLEDPDGDNAVGADNGGLELDEEEIDKGLELETVRGLGEKCSQTVGDRGYSQTTNFDVSDCSTLAIFDEELLLDSQTYSYSEMDTNELLAELSYTSDKDS